MITALKAKIHHCRVTETKKDYVGSIFICKELLREAGIVPYERVLVCNVTNGERYETYAVPAEKGVVSVRGASARLAEPGDVLIVLAWETTDEAPAPNVVFCDAKNRMIGGPEHESP